MEENMNTFETELKKEIREYTEKLDKKELRKFEKMLSAFGGDEERAYHNYKTIDKAKKIAYALETLAFLAVYFMNGILGLILIGMGGLIFTYAYAMEFTKCKKGISIVVAVIAAWILVKVVEYVMYYMPRYGY